MTLQQIGVVRNGVSEPVDEGWGSVTSELRIEQHLEAGLLGLADCSHLVVVFLMHRAEFDPVVHLRRRPRNRGDMPELGIFAQRARHRPNPIGISTVAVEGVRGASVFVRGLDAIDGTPILDIKPFVPLFDAPEGARAPVWIGRLLKGYF